MDIDDKKQIADSLNQMKETLEQTVWETMKDMADILGLTVVEPDKPSTFKVIVPDEAPAHAESDVVQESLEEDNTPDPDPIDFTHLPNGLAKFKTDKGWYIRVLIDEDSFDASDYATDDEMRDAKKLEQTRLERWLCSERTEEQKEAQEQYGLLMWVQALPKRISGRRYDKKDRSYPSKAKTGIYVNAEEMDYIESLAMEQSVPVREREFGQ